MVRPGRRRRRGCSCDSAGGSTCSPCSVGASGASSDSRPRCSPPMRSPSPWCSSSSRSCRFRCTRRSSSSCTSCFRARRRRCCAASRRSSSASPPPARTPRRAWAARRGASGSRSSWASCCRAGPSCWTASIVARGLLLGGVVVALLVALVAQRRAMAGALQSHDPRRLDQERTILVGVRQQINTFLAEHIDPTLRSAGGVRARAGVAGRSAGRMAQAL